MEHYAADRFVHPAALFAPHTEGLTAWHKRQAERTSDTEETHEADADPGDGAPARDDIADDPESDHLVAAE